MMIQTNPDAVFIQAAQREVKRAAQFLTYAKAADTPRKALRWAYEAMEAAEVAGEQLTDFGCDATDANGLWLKAETFALSVIL